VLSVNLYGRSDDRSFLSLRKAGGFESCVTRWLGCVFSPALHLELRRVISALRVGICRSFRITAFGTYHGASVIRRRAFN
jgi:hypothetical protein